MDIASLFLLFIYAQTIIACHFISCECLEAAMFLPATSLKKKCVKLIFNAYHVTTSFFSVVFEDTLSEMYYIKFLTQNIYCVN